MNLLALLTMAGISSIAGGGVDTTKIHLSDLDLSAMLQDYKTPNKNLSVEGNPLTIAGQKFENGVGTHANSFMCIRLSGKAVRFTAMVGLDGEVGKNGSVNFVIKKDFKKVWESGVMRGGDPAKAVDIDVRGTGRLGLIVEETPDGNDSDHADWANATIEMVKDAPAPVLNAIPVDPPMKIASGVSQKTQIHGARIVGCTPGYPFLFKIPATGKKPLVYAAKGLPEGLSLNAETGVISGKVAQAGETKVVIEVKGPKGKDTRELTIVAGTHKLALTPPMGWNSWNCWAGSVSADKVRDAGKAMVESGLADFGYQYVNIDDCWEAGRDANGEIQTNTRFGDMKKLGEDIHAMGLKLGIYSSPGPRTCAGYEGSYKHEFQDAKTYANWGIDYLKYDWCSYGGVAKDASLYEYQKPYILMRDGLDASGRDIVFSLCQYGMGDVYKWGKRIGGNLWRTTGDINDSWSSMAGIGFIHSEKSPYIKPGGWNDPDMLVVGMVGWSANLHPTNLKPNEQITHITLWSMLAAPLIIGCDMTRLDQFTKDLLMNHDVIEVDQDPLGKAAVQVWKNDTLEVWTRPLWDGSTAVALFNRGNMKAKLSVTWKELGFYSDSMKVRDLWLQKDLGTMAKGITRDVMTHGAMMFKVKPVN
jgi:alpha-galactosidase